MTEADETPAVSAYPTVATAVASGKNAAAIPAAPGVPAAYATAQTATAAGSPEPSDESED